MSEASARLSAARRALAAQEAECRTLSAKAVDLLKGTLGRVWNPQWALAGFASGNLAVMRADQGVILSQLATYYREHPDEENVKREITAAKLQAGADAVEAARGKREECVGLLRTAREERNLALSALRARLRVLRAELDRVLPDTDGRWYQFGFTRPADGHLPSPITDLTAGPGIVGSVVVRWARSIVARNYRVTWRLKTGDPKVNEPGLFTDPQALLTGLPSGQTIVVSVSARNKSGETAVQEVSTVVP